MSGYRLPHGGLVDRGAAMSLRFDGRPVSAFAGDTLASALLASGATLLARSFKYHRPRGLFTAGGEEPNALVELGEGARREPNTPATLVEALPGLVAVSQNRWPSLRWDLAQVNGLAGPLFAAGFYYKTFMWPAALWERLYEPAIRRAAGMGRASGLPDPDHYDTAHTFCDLLVVGAGPAGLAAAQRAARGGLRVILADADFRLGGRLNSEVATVDDQAGADWAADVLAELVANDSVRILLRTTVFGAYDAGVFGAVERLADSPTGGAAPRERLWKIAARRTVLATGAVEQPIIFGGNDRPGVMQAGAVRTYLNRFAVSPGRRVAIFTASDDGWRTAADLQRAGVEVVALIDPRPQAPTPPMAQSRAEPVPTFVAARVIRTFGGSALHGIEIVEANGRRRRIAADVLAVSAGWSPSAGLGAHRGRRPVWSSALGAFVAEDLDPGLRLAGAASGEMTLGRCLASGFAAATAALEDLGRAVAEAAPKADDEPASRGAFWRVKDSAGLAFVDLQHDVTTKDIALATQEGFASVELMKRYTTLGMATDQGKTSNLAGYSLLAEETGRDVASAGVILSRPPDRPVAIGALAGAHRGDHFRPVRTPPSHAWAEARGAVFVDTGQWKRAQWYPQAGESHWRTSVDREVRAVRSGVGFCDVSTLGKVEVMGADAGLFLNRIYINTFSTLPVGRCRYGLMLREDGFALDDGTVARLGEDRFVLTATTVNAPRVMQHLEFARQALWPELNVQLATATEQWAQFAIAGRRSRDLLLRLLGDLCDLSEAAFPYMAATATRWRGAALRLFRLSFSGEQAYEIAVPAARGDALVRALFEAGEDLGLTPYGTEALGVMRIEKGHAAGPELNGQTTARDLGLLRMMATKKDYIGRTMAGRPALVSGNRPGLVGLRSTSPSEQALSGSHLLRRGAAACAENDEGWVSSSVWSPTLQSYVALGFLRGGSERIGETLRACDLLRGRDVDVDVCSPVFFDPNGERLHGRY